MSLVGRDSEVAALRTTVDLALRGQGRVTLLTGEPGLGKTALAAATAAYAEAEGACVAWADCWLGGGRPPFKPWAQVLAALGQEELLTRPAADRYRRFMDVADALAGAAARRPLLVVLDDLDRADAGSRRLLEFLTRYRGRSRLCLVGTGRDGVTPLAGPVETHALSGLAPDATGRLLAELGVDGDPAAVHRRTGGNPYHIRELAQPSRLDALPPETLDRLATAALVGPVFPVGLVGASRLGPALRAGVIRTLDDEHCAFVHDLLRTAVLERLGPAERRCRHAHLARAVARREPPDPFALAFHCGRAEPGIDAGQAHAALVAAAREAHAGMAYEEATGYWRVAARLSTEDLVELGDAASRSGDRDEARDAYRRAAEDPAQLARAAIGLHTLDRPARVGEPWRPVTTVPAPEPDGAQAERIGLLERALDATAEPAPMVLAALAAELADGTERDPARARSLALSAVAAADVRPDHEARVECLSAQHEVLSGPGTARERLGIADRMIAAAGSGPFAFRATFCRFMAEVELGEPGVDATLRELGRLARASRRPRERYLVLTRRSTLDIMRGDYDSAATGMAEALVLGELLDEPDRMGVYLTQQLAIGLAREGLDAVQRMAQPYAAVVPAGLEPERDAIAAAVAGDPAAGAAVLLAAPSVLERPIQRRLALSVLAFDCEIAVAAHAVELCRRSYGLLAPFADEVIVMGQATAVLGPVSLYLGLLAMTMGEPERAVTHLADALATARALGARPLFARIREHLASIPGPTPGTEPAEFRLDGESWTITYRRRTIRLPDAKGLHDLAVLLASPGEEIPALTLVDDRRTDERGRSGERARTTVTARIRDSLRRIEQLHPTLGEHLRRSVTTGRTCAYRPADPVTWRL